MRPAALKNQAIDIRCHRSGLRYGILGSWETSKMDDKTALHATFYNNEKELIEDMSDSDLEAHIEELAAIAFEARARINAGQDKKRERQANSDNQKVWLSKVEDGNFDSNAAIGAVEGRKKRQSKSDKLFGDMTKLLGVDGAAALIGQLDKTKFNPEQASLSSRIESATSKPLAELCRIDRHSECTGSFRLGDKGESTKCSCKCHVEKFNADDLFAPQPNPLNPIVVPEVPEMPVTKAFNPDDLFN